MAIFKIKLTVCACSPSANCKQYLDLKVFHYEPAQGLVTAPSGRLGKPCSMKL